MLIWIANKIMFVAILYAAFKVGKYVGANGWDNIFD